MDKRTLRTVVTKEVKETLRDRRSLYSTFLMPFIGAGLILFLVNKISDKTSETKELDLHVQGADYAPALIDRLKRKHIKIEPAPKDPVAALNDQSINALLVIPKNYDRAMAQGQSIKLEFKADLSNSVASQTVNRAKSVIAAYGSELTALRIAARGVAMNLLRSFAVKTTNLATDAQRSATLTQLLIMFSIITASAGGMYVAIDSTAGERERKSLEPLLNTPVSTLTLIVGKWIASTSVALFSCALTLLMLRQALLWSPFESLGLKISLGPEQLGMIFLCMVPLAMMMNTFQLLIGIFARSYREAQTYMATFMLVPMLPSYLYDRDNGAPDMWMHAIPTLSQHIQSLAVLRGEAIAPIEQFLSAGVCLAITPLVLYVLARLLRSEKIVYGR